MVAAWPCIILTPDRPDRSTSSLRLGNPGDYLLLSKTIRASIEPRWLRGPAAPSNGAPGAKAALATSNAATGGTALASTAPKVGVPPSRSARGRLAGQGGGIMSGFGATGTGTPTGAGRPGGGGGPGGFWSGGPWSGGGAGTYGRIDSASRLGGGLIDRVVGGA